MIASDLIENMDWNREDRRKQIRVPEASFLGLSDVERLEKKNSNTEERE